MPKSIQIAQTFAIGKQARGIAPPRYDAAVSVCDETYALVKLWSTQARFLRHINGFGRIGRCIVRAMSARRVEGAGSRAPLTGWEDAPHQTRPSVHPLH